MLKLKELRIKKGLSQTKLAKIIFVSQGAISQYENGINEPDIQTIKKLCDYFGVSADYLLNNINHRFNTIKARAQAATGKFSGLFPCRKDAQTMSRQGV